MSDKKLLPCPFCGGEAKIEWESWSEIAPTIGTYRLSVNHALDCMFVRMNGTNYKSEMISNSKEQLAETWNTRKPMERIVERLEETKNKTFVSGITYNPYEFGCCHGMDKAIEIVKEEGGLND